MEEMENTEDTKNAGRTFRITKKSDLGRKTHKSATTTSWTQAPYMIIVKT